MIKIKNNIFFSFKDTAILCNFLKWHIYYLKVPYFFCLKVYNLLPCMKKAYFYFYLQPKKLVFFANLLLIVFRSLSLTLPVARHKDLSFNFPIQTCASICRHYFPNMPGITPTEILPMPSASFWLAPDNQSTVASCRGLAQTARPEFVRQSNSDVTEI